MIIIAADHHNSKTIPETAGVLLLEASWACNEGTSVRMIKKLKYPSSHRGQGTMCRTCIDSVYLTVEIGYLPRVAFLQH